MTYNPNQPRDDDGRWAGVGGIKSNHPVWNSYAAWVQKYGDTIPRNVAPWPSNDPLCRVSGAMGKVGPIDPNLKRLEQPPRPLADKPEIPPQAAPKILFRPRPPSPEVRLAAKLELECRGLNSDLDYADPEANALATLADGRALSASAPVPDLSFWLSTSGKVKEPAFIGHQGYRPAPGDETTLARMIFAETGDVPEDSVAIGWAIVNRIGERQFGKTLDEVLHQRGQYSFVKEGHGPENGSSQWQKSATPEKLTGPDAVSWAVAKKAAEGILDGTLADVTGGANHYFSATNYSGLTKNAPGDFSRMLSENAIHPAPYHSKGRGPKKNYFFIEADRK